LLAKFNNKPDPMKFSGVMALELTDTEIHEPWSRLQCCSTLPCKKTTQQKQTSLQLLLVKEYKTLHPSIQQLCCSWEMSVG